MDDANLHLTQHAGNAGIGAWEMDLHSNVVSCSSSWYALRGRRTNGTITADALLRDVHAEDFESLKAHREALIAGEYDDFSCDYRIMHADGTWRWIEERTQVVCNEDGYRVQLVGFELDITSRKRKEQTLSKRLAKYLSRVESFPIAICRFNGSQCIYANQSWSEMTGRSRESAIGDGWLNAVHPEDRERVWLNKPGTSGTEGVLHGVSGRHLNPDGSVRWFTAESNADYAPDGEIIGSTVVMIDITELKDLESQQARLVAILEATTDIIGICTPAGQLVWANNELKTLRPEYTDPNVTHEVATSYPGWALERLEKEAKPTAIANGVWSGETALLNANDNDKEFPVSQVLIAHKAADGTVESFSTIMRDITEKNRVESALRDSERMYASLAAAAPVSIFRLDATGQNCLFANQRSSEFTGRAPEASLGQGFRDFVEPGDLKELKRRFIEFMKDSSRVMATPHELRHVLPDGSHAWAEVNVGKELDDQGNVTGYVGTLTALSRIKQAEQSLSRLGGRLRNILKLSLIGTWEWSITEQRLAWDEQMLTIYGVEPADFSGKFRDWAQRLHPDDYDRATSTAGENELPPDYSENEFRIIRPNGEVRHIYASQHIEHNERGEPIRKTGVNMDITDRRNAELALRDSENKFQRIAENMPGMAYRFVLFPDGTEELEYVGPQVREIYELEPEDVIGNIDALRTRYPAKDVARVKQALAKSAATLELYSAEYQIFLPKKGQRWVQSMARPVRADDGRIIWDGIMFDLTEKKQSQIALQDAQRRLQITTENLPGMIAQLVLKPQGDWSVTYVSRHCRDLLELEPEQLLAELQMGLDRVHPDDKRGLLEAIVDSAKTLSPLDHKFRVVLPRQGQRWLQSMGQPTRTDNGSVTFDGLVIDITHQKLAELHLQLANDELASATKMKDEFLANMSHELRTPLNAILGMAEGLQTGVLGATTEKQNEGISVIQQSGLHLLELINEVLDLAKIESGSVDLDYSSVSVAKLCESSLQLVAQQAEKKGIELNLSVPFNLPNFEADEKRLKQVLVNLLSNAVKFTGKDGTVTVLVQRLKDVDGEKLRIAVSDTGIGIAADHLDTLFDPFVQVDSSLSRNYEGTGLGLSLVRRFVELHGGAVNVQSEPGSGSCFTLELPFKPIRGLDVRASQPLDSEAFEKSVDKKLLHQPASILLAEDNELVAKTTTYFLEASNFKVQIATNGFEAIEMARNQLPDAILMDVQMPGLSGLEAIKQIRENPALADTPIIVLTGLAMQSDASRCLAAGANHYLSKPTRMQELIGLIRRLLVQRDPDVRINQAESNPNLH